MERDANMYSRPDLQLDNSMTGTLDMASPNENTPGLNRVRSVSNHLPPRYPSEAN